MSLFRTPRFQNPPPTSPARCCWCRLAFPPFGISAAAGRRHRQIALGQLFRRNLTAAPFCLLTYGAASLVTVD